MNLLEKWKNSVDKGKSFGALLTDPSKAFDCVDHELLTAKLNAYGFTLPALRLIHDYLSNRKQRTKINDNYSPWSEILFGIPQGSILGPLLINIFLADLFLVVKDIDIANYADNSTPFIVENNIDIGSKIIVEIGDYKIDNSECEKLLGEKIDVNLNFNDHISDLYKKASRKISALARVTPFMGLSEKKLLMNAFFTSQFSYCPLTWMCHSRTNNRKINMLHERFLRIIYNGKQSYFTELRNKGNSVSIHIRNIHCN